MNYAIEINGLAIIVLIIVFVAMRQNKGITYKKQRHFYSLIYLLIPILIVDSLGRMFDGITTNFGFFMNHTFNFLLYSLSGFLVLFWFLYVLDFLNIKLKNKQGVILKTIYFLPAIIIFIMSVFSIFYDVFYVINDNNIYARGSLYFVYVLIFYGYVISVSLLIFANFNKRPVYESISLLSLLILPVIGGLIQSFVYGVSLLYPMSSISILILFIFVQLRLVRIDSLTLLSNKYDFNRHVNLIDQKSITIQNLGCVLVDINNFKSINDKFGHRIGDEVLIEVSKVLKKTFTNYNNIVARVGGDEFGILINVANQQALNQKISELNQNIDLLNSTDRFDFKLSLSIGNGIYNRMRIETLENYLTIVDLQMITNKRR